MNRKPDTLSVETALIPLEDGTYYGYWTGYTVSIEFESLEVRFSTYDSSPRHGLAVLVQIERNKAKIFERPL